MRLPCYNARTMEPRPSQSKYLPTNSFLYAKGYRTWDEVDRQFKVTKRLAFVIPALSAITGALSSHDDDRWLIAAESTLCLWALFLFLYFGVRLALNLRDRLRRPALPSNAHASQSFLDSGTTDPGQRTSDRARDCAPN